MLFLYFPYQMFAMHQQEVSAASIQNTDQSVEKFFKTYYKYSTWNFDKKENSIYCIMQKKVLLVKGIYMRIEAAEKMAELGKHLFWKLKQQVDNDDNCVPFYLFILCSLPIEKNTFPSSLIHSTIASFPHSTFFILKCRGDFEVHSTQSTFFKFALNVIYS